MKFLTFLLSVAIVLTPLTASAAPVIQYFTNIAPFTTNVFDNGTSTNVWKNVWTNALHMPLELNGCAQFISGSLSSTGASCGSGGSGSFAWPFDVFPNYVSTTTTLGFFNGFFSTASSTISGPFRLPSLSQGILYVGSGGLVNTAASSTLLGGFSPNSIITSNSVGQLIATGSQLTTGSLISTTSVSSYFTGSLGIGTNNPGQKLDVSGSVNVTNNIFLPIVSGGLGGNIFFGGDVSAGSDGMRLYSDSSGGNISTKNTLSNGGIIFLTDTTNGSKERMRITVAGNVGIGTTSPGWPLQISSTTASATFKPQLALSDFSAGTNLKHWIFASEGGNLYLSTSTDTFATTSISALEISGSGFGTTTLRGLNISGQATSTSNVGFNITTGCYAISGTCISGSGSSNNPGGTGTELQYRAGPTTFGATMSGYDSASTRLSLGTTTSGIGEATIASSTEPQLTLSAGVGISQWTFRNAGGNLYIATTTVQGTATGTVSALSIVGSLANVGIGTNNPTDVNANSRLTVAGPSSQDIIASTTDNTTLSDAILQVYAPGSRVFMGAHGTNQVSSRYGLTLGGWGEISAFNSTFGSTNGLVIGTNTAVPLVFGTNNLERYRTTGPGFTGYGTTTPFAQLQIATTSANAGFKPQLTLTDANGPLNGKHWYVNSMSGIFDIGTTSDTGTYATSSAFSISAPNTASPNTTFGIGTTSPYATLSVQGASGQDVAALGTSTAVISLRINRDGQIFLGNYANCNGTSNALGITSNQILCDSLVSDIRLKKDIEPFSGGLETILKLKPVSFYWNDLTNHNTTDPRIQYGFIAQEVEKVIPSAVGNSPDGYKTLDKTSFIAPMIDAIQRMWTSITDLIDWNRDQDKSIKRLEEQNSAQQRKIELLQEQINNLK